MGVAIIIDAQPYLAQPLPPLLLLLLLLLQDAEKRPAAAAEFEITPEALENVRKVRAMPLRSQHAGRALALGSAMAIAA